MNNKKATLATKNNSIKVNQVKLLRFLAGSVVTTAPETNNPSQASIARTILEWCRSFVFGSITRRHTRQSHRRTDATPTN